MSKRQIKKRILAEALKVYREQAFPIRSFTMRGTDGNYTHVIRNELERPFDMLSDLMHECARLEGDMP